MWKNVLEDKEGLTTKIQRLPLIFMFWCLSDEGENIVNAQHNWLNPPAAQSKQRVEKTDWSHFNFPTNFFLFQISFCVQSNHSGHFGCLSQARKHLLTERQADGSPDDTFFSASLERQIHIYWRTHSHGQTPVLKDNDCWKEKKQNKKNQGCLSWEQEKKKSLD